MYIIDQKPRCVYDLRRRQWQTRLDWIALRLFSYLNPVRALRVYPRDSSAILWRYYYTYCSAHVVVVVRTSWLYAHGYYTHVHYWWSVYLLYFILFFFWEGGGNFESNLVSSVDYTTCAILCTLHIDVNRDIMKPIKHACRNRYSPLTWREKRLSVHTQKYLLDRSFNKGNIDAKPEQGSVRRLTTASVLWSDSILCSKYSNQRNSAKISKSELLVFRC